METNPIPPPAQDTKPADVLTVDEAAVLLRLNRKTLYQAIAEGKVPGTVRIGRAIRISRSALESWMQTGGA
jgi:excisionase family DNA binding protein